MRYLGDFCVEQGVFAVGLFNDVSQIPPRPTLVAMATKFELELAITQLICEMSRRFLRPAYRFPGPAIEWCHSNSTTTDPGCHGNEIGDKIGYNSACMQDISDILAPKLGVFVVWLLNDASQILPRPTLVAMATKIEAKLD